MKLADFISQVVERLETVFQQDLAESLHPSHQLKEAILYSLYNGGKRIRPLLVYLTGRALGASFEQLDGAACAIELIHTYSLIHDDLPAMDNADLRRGKPSCHKVFGEALAILAGDALQSFAFETLAARPAPLTAEQRIAMVNVLSQASGNRGMAGGQALDLANIKTFADLTPMYHLKTGALLEAAVTLGAIAADCQDATLFSLQSFAKHLALAFQIQDDLLDEEESQLTGKPQGLDQMNQKITYVSLAGKEISRQKTEELFMQALFHLETLGSRADLLIEFTHTLLRRKK